MRAPASRGGFLLHGVRTICAEKSPPARRCLPGAAEAQRHDDAAGGGGRLVERAGGGTPAARTMLRTDTRDRLSILRPPCAAPGRRRRPRRASALRASQGPAGRQRTAATRPGYPLTDPARGTPTESGGDSPTPRQRDMPLHPEAFPRKARHGNAAQKNPAARQSGGVDASSSGEGAVPYRVSGVRVRECRPCGRGDARRSRRSSGRPRRRSA